MLKKFNRYRDISKFLLETIVWSLVTVIAFLLRLDGNLAGFESEVIWSAGTLLILKSASILYFGTFRQSWRNTGFRDLFTLLRSVLIVSIIFLVGTIAFRGTGSFTIPLSVPLIELALSLLVLSGLRVATRFYFVYRNPNKVTNENSKRVLIAGAGESGNMAAREMFRHPEAGLKPVAFLDDDKSKHGQKFLGLPVVGTIDDMKKAVEHLNIDQILIAMPSESGKVIRRVVDYAGTTGVRYKIIPSIYDLISGKVTINQIRNVDVEDLLRRKPVELNMSLIEGYIAKRTVLVTGAGGSIGSEIVKQLTRFNPDNVILLGRGENSIHQLVNEIEFSFPDLNYSIQIADVRDEGTMERVFKTYRPEVIFHAAAHKHVPLMEANPEQAILNNVLGTRNLVNMAVKYNVVHFVNISTDKAVNPTSVMGASKRISEQIVQWGASQAKGNQSFVSVRFGNVLGSRGSVIPKFKEQIKRGGPVSITHPDMVRYFMTIPEASQLVLQAGALNMNGSVYVLDMGDPVNIENMARDLIVLSGLEPDKDIKIEYTGIRPGEKLYEELLTAEEGTDMTHHEKIYVARSVDLIDNLEEQLNTLIDIAKNGTREEVKHTIKEMLPTYSFKKKKVLDY
jgi:FlaA1/EpsC-like NDP-sugar epimerase